MDSTQHRIHLFTKHYKLYLQSIVKPPHTTIVDIGTAIKSQEK